MHDIAPWFGEVIAAVLAIMILVFATLLCLARSRAYASEVQATTNLVPSPTESALNLQNLSSELASVIDWFSLGLNLGLQKHELTKIERDYQGNDRRRVEMLDLWLQRTPNATWEDVVRALQQIGENTVAENIREKCNRGRSPSALEDSGTVEIAQKNKQTIDAKFATLLTDICSKLEGREIDMRQLQLYLRTFYRGEDIPNFSDIYEMLGYNKLWDFWNYLPLKKFVEKFAADDAEILSLFEAYKQDLKTYKVTTRLIDRISVAESDYKPEERQHEKSGREYYQEISVKLGDTTVADRSLEYVDDLWNELVGIYDLPPDVAILDSIREGCVLIVWRIPSHIASKILEAPPPSDEFYHKHGITRVEYGGEGIYQKRKFAVSGPGLTSATTNQVSKFIVRTYDTHHRRHPVSAKLKSLVDGSVLQATVVSQTPSTYELSYTPTTRGRHQLTVRVNNTEIGTFQVFVQHPPTQLGTPVRTIDLGVKPFYIAVDDKGELFVTEHWGRQYTVLDAQGQRVITMGSEGEPQLGFGIATDGEGNVYVASSHGSIASAHKVQKFNGYGQLVKSVGKWGKSPGEFDYPWGIRYYNHQVYVCDSDNVRIQVFDSDLNFIRSFGTRGDCPGQFKGPRDIDFDTQGNIYVVDYDIQLNGQVLVFSEDGQYLRHFGMSTVHHHGLCVSRDYVYVTENVSNCVSVFRTSGEFVRSFGRKESGRGELKHPRGIAVDKDGFVFVCDSGNSRIQVF